MDRTRCTTTALAACLLAAAAPAQNRVWIVDETGKPDADFTEIQPAIDAASDGDAVLVRHGAYDPFVIDGKSLDVLGEAGATAEVAAPAQPFPMLWVRNLSASQLVVLRGLDVGPASVLSSGDGASLRIEQCAGHVWVEDCSFEGFARGVFGPAAGPEVDSCASVTFVRSSLEGATGELVFSSTDRGSAGLLAVGSNVYLYDCTVEGGESLGGSCNVCQPVAPSGAGVRVDGGFLYAAGGSFLGGPGGDGCDSPSGQLPFAGIGADGGPGLELVGSSGAGVMLLDVSLSGGPGGEGGTGGAGCPDGAAGAGVVDPDGGSSLLAGRSHPLLTDSPLRVGETGTLRFEGDPGELVFLGFSPSALTFYFAPFSGASLLGLPASSIFLGVVPAGGAIELPVTIASLGAGTDAVGFFLQSVAVTLQAEIVLGGGSALELLSAAVAGPDFGDGAVCQVIVPSDPNALEFGGAIALDDTQLLVGAQSTKVGPFNNAGTAFVFDRSPSGWVQVAQLYASFSHANGKFGGAVALEAGRALVGEAAYSGGRVAVFEDGPGGWVRTQTLSSPVPNDSDSFGRSVALAGDTALIGSNLDVGGLLSVGGVHVFELGPSGWSATQLLTPGMPDQGDSFGAEIAADGGVLFASAHGDDDLANGSGAVYVFEETPSGWIEVQKLVASDGAGAVFATFGVSVAVQGSRAVVGAASDEAGSDSGSVYVFERGPSGWVETAKLAPPGLEANDRFGTEVALDGDTILVSAPGDDDGSLGGGAVYVFEESGGSWVQTGKLYYPFGGSYGTALALDGDSAFVGTRFTNPTGTVEERSLSGNCP